MTSKLKLTVVAVALLAATAGLSLAQQGKGSGMGMGGPMMGGGMGRGMGMGHMMRGGMMGGCGMGTHSGRAHAHGAGRVAFLKAELGITDAQKEAWEAYEKVLKSNFDAMEGMHQTMMAAMNAKTPIERLEFRLTAMEGRVNNLKAIKEPLGKLYAALSDAQKEKANDLLTGMGCMR